MSCSCIIVFQVRQLRGVATQEGFQVVPDCHRAEKETANGYGVTNGKSCKEKEGSVKIPFEKLDGTDGPFMRVCYGYPSV